MAYTFWISVGWIMRSLGPLGCSIKVSVLTSRHPLHSDETRSNSDLIQLRAATMPCEDVAAPGLLTESVLRVPKLTSFSSVCWARWGETSFMIWMMAGSRSCLGQAEDFSAGSGAAARVLGLCFWATAKGAASIRSAIETKKEIRRRESFIREFRSNIQFLGFQSLTTIPRDSKYNHVALATL